MICNIMCKTIVTLAIIAVIYLMLLVTILWSERFKRIERKKRKWEIQDNFLKKVKSIYPFLKKSLVYLASQKINPEQWKKITKIIKALKIEESRKGGEESLYFWFRGNRDNKWINAKLNGIGNDHLEYRFEVYYGKGKKKEICFFDKISMSNQPPETKKIQSDKQKKRDTGENSHAYL
jgi:hypothetical protein